MSLKEKLLGKSKVSRRDFLKGVSAAGATAAVYGCGGDGDAGRTYMEEDEASRPTPPEISGTTVMGATPHNCGGRCVSKYYIEEGVVKRIVTDENEDVNDLGTTNNDPQRRSCVRCRSRKQWFYRQDRLMYPLKQTGERGDVNGFVRISWEQAFSEIGAKLKEIAEDPNKGPETFHRVYASADSTGWSSASVGRLFNMLGGSLPYRDDYSWPSLDHMATFVEGVGYIPEGSCRQDIVNAEHVFLWSYNGLEAVWGTQSGWYLVQTKEMGIPMTAVDTRFSKTAATVANDFVNITPGTDAALLLGILYHLLTSRYSDLDIDFIKAHVHGFFDDPSSTSYHDSVADGTYNVPEGASLSAYVMGNETALVDAGLNAKTSVYPDTIGYNVNSEDELYGKRTMIYGQTPKTPEWAEKITGIPASKIRSMANTLLDKKCTIWNGSGFQRNTEAEQPVWLLRIMSAVTKNFGAEGCSYGMQRWSWVGGPSNGMYNIGSSVDLSSDLYDSSELTVSGFYSNSTNSGTIPVFIWQDAVDYGGTGKSRWNDGQIKALKKGVKVVFNFAGNCLANQSGDVNYYNEVLKDRSKAELLVTADHWLTSSALLSDYVLPASMQMEKPGASTGWFSEEVVAINQVLETPAEVKSEYDICAGIAGALGRENEFTEGKTMEQRLSEGWQSRYESGYYDITWDQFKEQGLWKPAAPTEISFKDFRDNPSANPVSTPSGKFEAYSQFVMEDYQARFYDNYDSFGTLENGGAIADAKNPAGSNAMRFVYPIPMYIPPVEGRHADGSHPDPLGKENSGLDFTLHTWHLMYRSHSTLNNVAYMNELYKYDEEGNPAFLPETREPAKDKAPTTWEDGAYESVWLNPIDAEAKGIKTGDRLKISNGRGAILVSAIVTQRVPSKVVYIGQGSWHYDENGVDVGGCANTLTHARPARISQGMTLANDCRVKIEKA
ncbi:molybdopterin-dependent oxidoreductase [Limisalsivibrio acetivorans]|uniref:molybdopterin-dependent oxidoreductase n=1 Tax=Limisalsivibrio acetivorans TaxID=1304888 RepID=UPI0003B6F770|nr:molybdopterin-dependent oxidoreductase [Limisalsivibrio acetivorans]